LNFAQGEPAGNSFFFQSVTDQRAMHPRFAAARGYSFALSATSIKLSYNSVDR